MEELWTIGKLINWGKEYFAQKNIDNPRLNIELMLCKILNCERIDLYLKYEYPLKREQLDILRDMVIRRANREPLQYILGEVYFYNLKFKIDNRALIPRSETELLVEQALIFLNSINKQAKIIDVGTGSGCIAISIAKHFPNSDIIALDISENALDLARENAKLHRIDNITFLHQNFFTYKAKQKFDLIVSNPPYVLQNDLDKFQPELKYEPQLALTTGEDGIKFYRRLFEFLENLEDRGAMLIELNEKTSNEVTKLVPSLYKSQIIKDYAGLDRIMIVQKITNL